MYLPSWPIYVAIYIYITDNVRYNIFLLKYYYTPYSSKIGLCCDMRPKIKNTRYRRFARSVQSLVLWTIEYSLYIVLKIPLYFSSETRFREILLLRQAIHYFVKNIYLFHSSHCPFFYRNLVNVL